ncbi:MAG: type VI secretion system baseplate subunit TssG [Rhodocyclaceae bacterium]
MRDSHEAGVPADDERTVLSALEDIPPWKMSLLGLMRTISARQKNRPVIGCARRPQDEAFRLKQSASLAFSPREIDSVQVHDEGLSISVLGLGMLGPNGPLPLHFTEIVRNRSEFQKDTTTADFLGIFHHRWMTLFYRAWANAEATAGLDRADDEDFSRYVGWLIGQESEHLATRHLPAHAHLAAAPHLVREARNPDGIAATLQRFFGVPVRLQEHMLYWMSIEPAGHCRLGHSGPQCMLGQGALLGEMVPDRQYKFRLVFGPLDLDHYLALTPQGRDLPVLVDWVRTFVGYEFQWDIELYLRPQEAPPAHLGGIHRLGWATWLGTPDPGRMARGMVYEPEYYARGRS